MKDECCMVLTTFADEVSGQQMIDALLSERQAACVQVLPIQSFYRWKGKINCDAEKLVLIKTRRSLYAKVQATVLAYHVYELPEIVMVPLGDGLPAYLEWIGKECSEPTEETGR